MDDFIKTFVKNIKDDLFGYIEKLSIDEIVKIINIASDYYYNNEPIISDNTFDILIDYLRLKDPKNKVLKKIGAPVKSKNKVELPYFLGSMEKFRPYIDSEVKLFSKWVNNYKQPYYLSDKLDGVSALLVYNFDGSVKLYSRGEATIGMDLTPLLKYLKKIPLSKDVEEFCKYNNYQGKRSYLAFRGELIIPKDIFKKKWSNKFKNVRNTVAGVVNSKKINPELTQDVRFVVYNILDPISKISKQYDIIKQFGMYLVHHKKVNKLDMKYLNKYLIKRKEEGKYDIDGIIVTNDDYHPLNEDGNPEYAFAFKNIDSMQSKETVVIGIEWNKSKDGRIKPTILIKDTIIGGVTIKRVTGNNARFIKENGIGIGAVIEIIRSGDVIPKVNKIIKKGKESFPDYDYIWDKNNVDIIVKNKDSREVNIKNIYYFFSQLGTKGLGERIVEKLYDNNYKTIKSIIELKKDDLLKIDGFKEKSSTNLINNIKKSLNNKTLAEIMNASNKLGSGMGIERMKLITSMYPNILNNNWSRNDFINNIKKIDGFDTITATIFVDNFKHFLEFYNQIKNYLNLREIKVKSKGKFSNMKIVLSGFRDKELSEYIENEGGVITNTISKNTSLLIIKDSSVMNTSKVSKAKDLGIKIITRDEINYSK
jgi:DNA ligase (NAD+)